MRYLSTILFFFYSILLAHPNFTGYSGAAGSSGTCASSCHGSGSGTITVLGLPSDYEPLKTYTVIVTHSSGSSIANFNASTRIGNSSTVAGTFASLSGTSIYSASSEKGVHASANNIDTAKFEWTAPAAGTGDVGFYVSGLQGSKSGQNTKVVSTISEGTTTDIQEKESPPLTFNLEQNYPNPFNPTTTIQYSVPKDGQYSLVVYNILGKEVVTLFNDEISPGAYTFTYNASALPSGIYFYTLSGKNNSETRKMILMK